jgi:hypothetical protein
LTCLVFLFLLPTLFVQLCCFFSRVCAARCLAVLFSCVSFPSVRVAGASSPHSHSFACDTRDGKKEAETTRQTDTIRRKVERRNQTHPYVPTMQRSLLFFACMLCAMVAVSAVILPDSSKTPGATYDVDAATVSRNNKQADTNRSPLDRRSGNYSGR